MMTKRIPTPLFSPVSASILAALLLLPAAAPAQKKGCVDDADCRKGRLCHAASCVVVPKNQSLLRVRLAAPARDPAYLWVDDVLMGELPFEDIVAAGEHSIRVESHGMLPVAFSGDSRGGMADLITIELKPIPPPPPPPQYHQPAPPPGDEDDPVIGRLHAGLYGGFGYGTAGSVSSAKRPATILQGGATIGAALLREPVWLDVGLGISSTTIRIEEWAPDFGEFLKLNFGLLVRLLFPLKQDFFYIGAELEPGYGYSNRRFAYAQVHLAMSLFVTDWLELRVNPLGMEFCQELMLRDYLAAFHATVGVIIRFGAF